MGNQVCTDQRPFSLDDLRKTKDEFPHRKALCEQSPLVLRSTQQAFDSFEHNVKAFSFRLGTNNAANSAINSNNSAGAVDDAASHVLRRSNVVSQTVSLRDTVAVDPSCAYVVLHIKRTDTKLLVPPRNAADTSAVVPEWAADSFAAFTPRGLATPFGIDIAAVRWRGRNAEERYKFEYSLHVYNGRASHQLVVAVATMQAFQLEKLLLNDVELLQRLFYGFNGAKPSELALPVPVGVLDFGDARIDLGMHRSRGPLRTVLQHHALLRNLYSVNLDISPTTSLTPRGSSGVQSNAVSPPNVGPTTTTVAATTTAAATSPSGGGRLGDVSVEVAQATSATTAADDTRRPSSTAASDPPPPSLSGMKFKLPLGAVIRPRDGDDDDAEPAVNRRSPQQKSMPPSAASAIGGRQPPKLNLTGIKSLSLPGAAAATQGVPASSGGSENLNTTQTYLEPLAPPTPNANAVQASGPDEADEVQETYNKIRKLKEQSPVATEVLPYLFVGGEEAAKDRSQLLSKGITHVVNAAAHSIPNMFQDLFVYTPLFLCDSPDEPLFSLIPLVNRIIEETRLKGGKTFIHCHQGVSRSCSLVIGFVMWKLGLCYDRAFAFVRDARKVCSPNSGFYVNLLRWEKQLSAPPLQCCWAFVPFSKEHTFPFVFRVETSQDSTAPFVFDSRCAYGLLTPSPDEEGEGAVHLLRGSECVDSYAAAAFAALELHLKYNFYTGMPKSSANDHNVTITYNSTTYMRRRITEMSTTNPRARGIASLALESHPNVLFQRDPSLNALLQNDLPQLLEQHLDEQLRLEGLAADRKRQREECLGASSPPRGVTERSPAKDDHRSVPTAWAPSTTGGNGALHDDEDGGDVRQPSSSPSTLLVDGEDSEAEEGTDSVLVFEYPFQTSEALDSILVIDDLACDKGYAIAVRGYRGAGVANTHRKPHHVYLWLGEEFTKDEDALRTAFRKAVSQGGALQNVRFTTRTKLCDVEDEVVYERDEPSDLLLAFA